MQKVLIIGGSSLLGRAIEKNAPYEFNLDKPQTVKCYKTYYDSPSDGNWRRLDVTDQMSLWRLFSDHKFDVVIYCSGFGNVDFCEKVPSVSYQMNVLAVRNVLSTLKTLGHKSKFIYISTNAVYDGDNPTYDEDSKQQPVNKYGIDKKDAENEVRELSDNYLIIRPFMLFGHSAISGRETWLEIILDKMHNGETLNLIDDIYWQPTSVDFVANSIWSLIDKGVSNTSFNVSQGTTLSLFNFGRLIVNLFDGDEEMIQPVSHKNFQTVATRPIDTSYDISKIEKIIKVPSLAEELVRLYKW